METQAGALAIETVGDAIRFAVRVTPRASRNEVGGCHGQALRVRITAAPVDGAANRAVIAILSKRLGVAKSAISIVRGDASRDKIISVVGVSADEVMKLVGD